MLILDIDKILDGAEKCLEYSEPFVIIGLAFNDGLSKHTHTFIHSSFFGSLIRHNLLVK